jgi:hypothetical protein
MSRLATILPPSRVRYPTDCRSTSSCSPPRLAATQLLSIAGLRLAQMRTRTALTKRPRGRTHPRECGDPRRGVGGMDAIANHNQQSQRDGVDPRLRGDDGVGAGMTGLARG